jgi:membrane protease YdiL (CAAX protease family)
MPLWLTYSFWTYLIAVPFYLLIAKGGGAAGERFNTRLRLMLWVPGAVALVFRLLTGAGFGDIPYAFSGIPLLLAAFFLPVLIEGLTITIVLLAGWGNFTPEILSHEDGKIRIGENFGLLFKEQLQAPARFALNLALSLLIGTIITTIFAVGSELGWRAYLQPMVLEAYGYPGGMVLVGLIWGYWLLPLVLGGYRYPYQPRLGAWLLMPLSTIAYSLIAGWLFLRAGNIWVPALFHASLLVTADLSEVGFGRAGGSLRVRLISLGLWGLAALALTVFAPR